LHCTSLVPSRGPVQQEGDQYGVVGAMRQRGVALGLCCVAATPADGRRPGAGGYATATTV